MKFLKLIRYSTDRSGHSWKDKRISDNLMILSDLSDSTVWPLPFPLLTTVSNLRLAGEKYSPQYFPTQSVSGNSIQCSDIWCLLHSIGCFKIFFFLRFCLVYEVIHYLESKVPRRNVLDVCTMSGIFGVWIVDYNFLPEFFKKCFIYVLIFSHCLCAVYHRLSPPC